MRLVTQSADKHTNTQHQSKLAHCTAAPPPLPHPRQSLASQSRGQQRTECVPGARRARAGPWQRRRVDKARHRTVAAATGGRVGVRQALVRRVPTRTRGADAARRAVEGSETG